MNSFNVWSQRSSNSVSNLNKHTHKNSSHSFADNITFSLNTTSYNLYKNQPSYIVKSNPGWGGSIRGGHKLKHNQLFYVELGFAVNKLNTDLFKESCLKRAYTSDYTLGYEASFSHKARLSTSSISFEYAWRYNVRLFRIEPFVKMKASMFNSRIGAFVYLYDSSGINNHFYHPEYSKTNLSIIPTLGIHINKQMTQSLYLVTTIETGYMIGRHHLVEEINIPNVRHVQYDTGINTPHLASTCSIGIMYEPVLKK